MKLKGNLESTGIIGLFQTLADEHATGILSISSPMGEKFIAVRDGAVSVFSDKLSDRARLGDLLVAGGQLSENQLAEALKYQRDEAPRSKLGDILIQKGWLDGQLIANVLRFQLAEEIFDLFAWKGSVYEFNSEMTVADVTESRTGYRRSMLNAGQKRFFDSLDLQPISNAETLLSDLHAFLPGWKELQKEFPNPYVCFKVTLKAQQNLSRTTAPIRKVLSLLKEGRTLETTVKRSCLGRVAVSKLVIKLLEDHWLEPYPVAGLRALASEHRAHKRYWDALNIYRRLLEENPSGPETTQLQQLIDDTIDSLLRAKVAGEQTEGVEAVNYKEAARQYLRRERHKRIGLGIFCFVSCLLIAFLLLIKFVPKPETPEAFQIALKDSEAAIEAHDYDKAMDIWEQLWNSIHNRDSELATRVLDVWSAVPVKRDTYVKSLAFPFEAKEKQGLLDVAEDGYRQLLKKYPKSAQAPFLEEALNRLAAKRAEVQHGAALDRLQNKLAEGRGLLERRQTVLAKAKFAEVAAEAEAGSEAQRAAEAELAKLAELVLKSRKSLAAAQNEARLHHGEKALAAFEKLAAEWPDLPAAQAARSQGAQLGARLKQARQALEAAALAEKKQDWTRTLSILRETRKEYAEFELAEDLEKRMAALEETASLLQKRLAEAQQAYSQNKLLGRQLYAALIRESSAFLANQKAACPVQINALPQATVTMNGKVIGPTPLETAWPMDQPVTLVFERPGYTRLEKNITQLTAEDLEILVRLKRAPLQTLNLPGRIFAPPIVLGENLYVLHGAALSALEPSGARELWELRQLFDEKAQSRPPSNGNGPDEPVPDKNWWFPRFPPEPFRDGNLLLALRSRDVLEIDPRQPSARKILALPFEPASRPFCEAHEPLTGKTLVALAGADGKIRAFDPAAPGAAIWEKPVDPANVPPAGALVSGLAPRANGIFLALSAAGRISALSVLDGDEKWSLDFKTPATERSQLPRTPEEKLAVLVHANGSCSVVDVNKRERLWQLSAPHAQDEVTGGLGGSNCVFLNFREGLLRKYEAVEAGAVPAALWERPLDGPVELPLVLGKLLYAATTFGTVYAIAPEDGRVIWEYRAEKKPGQLALYGKYLYLATQAGQVLVLNAE
jgi:hypothetical protein